MPLMLGISISVNTMLAYLVQQLLLRFSEKYVRADSGSKKDFQIIALSSKKLWIGRWLNNSSSTISACTWQSGVQLDLPFTGIGCCLYFTSRIVSPLTFEWFECLPCFTFLIIFLLTWPLWETKSADLYRLKTGFWLKFELKSAMKWST